MGAPLAERLGVKSGDRVVVGGKSLVVVVSGNGQSLTVASSLAQTVVGGNGWWLIFAPPGDEKKRDLGQTFGGSVGLRIDGGSVCHAGPRTVAGWSMTLWAAPAR